MDSAEDADLKGLRALLERTRRDRRRLTYLQVADALDLDPPHRIHRVAELLERLLEEDVEAGRVPLSALVVSKVRDGRPAPGFFERARSVGLPVGEHPFDFHDRLLDALYEAPDDAS